VQSFISVANTIIRLKLDTTANLYSIRACEIAVSFLHSIMKLSLVLPFKGILVQIEKVE
jgi:hypothetical protein